MSPATPAWSAVWLLVTAVATVRLLRASSQPVSSVRNGYRWLAVAVICLGVGGAVQQTGGGLIGGAQPLRVSDLLSLAALPALVIGIATLTADFARKDQGPADSGRTRREQDGAVQVWPARGIVLDSCLIVTSLFVLCFVTMFGRDYVRADVAPNAFALDLIRPVADLIALGLLVRFVPRSPRLSLFPVLALVALSVGDALAVGNRASGTAPATGSHLGLVIGIGLLAATPPAKLAGTEPAASLAPGHRWIGGQQSSPVTLAALAAAAAVALVVTGFSLFGGLVVTPALAVAGAIVVLLLLARFATFARSASVVAASAQASDWMFHALAETTSDAVLVCDLAGTIQYVSSAVGDFGYTEAELAGARLTDLVHPQDRPAGIRAGLAGLELEPGAATFAGRVRAADGSWRQIEATLSWYSQGEEPTRLLVACHDVSDLVALRRQLTQLTFHDGLTGLPNRAYVEERIKHFMEVTDRQEQQDGQQGSAARAAAVTAILIDLDGYTAVNDLVGQAGGDLLLAQAARRLRAAAPPSATVARWGGDEFVILAGDAVAGRAAASGQAATDQQAGTDEEAMDLAARLVGEIAAEPFSVAAKEVSLTASIGVAVSAASEADQVLGNAHLAKSKAKAAGGGRVAVYGAAMHAETQRLAILTADLRSAILEHRLEIEYQPVVEFATSRVWCVQALVGWSPAGELIGKDELIGIAERAGLTVQLGDWVLRTACRQVAAWLAAGFRLGLSVSCSFRQVSAPGFAASVLAALDEAGLPPQSLTLGVAERVLAESAGPTLADLVALRGKGVRLAIDDFGTGYTSLGHLRQLTADIIRIDPLFIGWLGADPTRTMLTKTIVTLGHDLGIEVIAPGIDRPEHIDQLRAMGCALGQGPAVAAPLVAARLEGLPVDLAGSWRQAAAGAVGPDGKEVGNEDVGNRVVGSKVGDPACSPAS